MLLDIEEVENQLIISYYDKNGRVAFKHYDTENIYNWQVCEENDKRKDKTLINWDGKPIKKYKGKSINKHALINFLDSLSKEDSDEIFDYNFPKTYFFDIEVRMTEIGRDSLDTTAAKNEVLTISLLTPEGKAVVMGTRDLDKKSQNKIAKEINKYFEKFEANFEFVYKKFNSEYDMLYTFMQMVSKIPMLSGWYCIGYDWSYLVSRCKRLGIDPSISSPTGKLNKDGTPMHVGMLDYAELYMNWDRSVGIKENGKLNTASKQVLGTTKITYEDNLQKLYDTDYERYVYYNAVDGILVHYIDQKLKTMQIVLTLSNICKIGLYKASSPVAITESFLSRALRAEGKMMATNWNETKKTGQYVGAYVKTPVVGKHRGVACFDYASLYPSIMRQFNISPDVYIEKLSKSQIESKRKQLAGKSIITSNGCVFNASEPSILNKVLTDLYAKRKEYKKKSFEYKMCVAACQEKLSKIK